jgi:hypothetical protein
MTGKTGLLWANILYAAVLFILCGMFFYAGILKLNSPQDFAIIVSEFGLVSESAVMPVAVLLPLVEVLAATGLFFDIRGALGTITFLLLFFIGILLYALWLGLDIDCGCFGPGDPEFHAFEGMRSSLYRDLFMMTWVVFLYLFSYLGSVKLIRLGDKKYLLTNREFSKVFLGICR